MVTTAIMKPVVNIELKISTSPASLSSTVSGSLFETQYSYGNVFLRTDRFYYMATRDVLSELPVVETEPEMSQMFFVLNMTSIRTVTK
jgi:hypothetical protein